MFPVYSSLFLSNIETVESIQESRARQVKLISLGTHCNLCVVHSHLLVLQLYIFLYPGRALGICLSFFRSHALYLIWVSCSNSCWETTSVTSLRANFYQICLIWKHLICQSSLTSSFSILTWDPNLMLLVAPLITVLVVLNINKSCNKLSFLFNRVICQKLGPVWQRMLLLKPS